MYALVVQEGFNYLTNGDRISTFSAAKSNVFKHRGIVRGGEFRC